MDFGLFEQSLDWAISGSIFTIQVNVLQLYCCI